MTRSGNRRRRVPFYPATPGTFQLKEQQPQDSDEQEHYKINSSDCLRDRQINGSDRRRDAGNGQGKGHAIRDWKVNGLDGRMDSGNGQFNGSDQRNDAGDRESIGKDCRNGSGDCQMNGQDYRYASNGSDHGFKGSDRPDMSKKDANEQKPHAPDSRWAQNHDRPANHYQHPHHYHHHHQQKNQRWEGKDTRDQNKDPAFTTGKELEKCEGKAKVKSQEYTAYMASRARELKEEGNRRFQRKDYLGAMDQYELALKLTPPQHPDRAVFHSNRAACLMQMKPVQFDAAIRECNLALEAHPGFARALLRRARAYEAVGKLELALQDVQLLLQGDVNHPDALDMARRIRLAMGDQGDEAQQDFQGSLSTSAALSHARSSVGVPSVANNMPGTPLSASRSYCMPDCGDNGFVLTPCQSSREMQTPSSLVMPPCQSSREMQTPMHASPQQVTSSRLIQMPPSPPSAEIHTNSAEIHTKPNEQSLPSTPPVDLLKVESSEKIIHQDNSQSLQFDTPVAPPLRPLKLIYDHDIRLADMPANCKFGELRKLVKTKFPSSKAILIKYKDIEGDLVTITSTEDLRLAEAAAAVEAARRNVRLASMSAEGGMPQDRRPNSAIGLPVVSSVLDQLRLHVVEVPAEQEPHDKEDTLVVNAQEPFVAEDGAAKPGTSETKVVKEKDFDKWLLEFAHLFRTHLGIDPNGHVDFHDLGIQLCAEALEETITTEEAHKLFEQAGCKFQEMVALGFFNWGNVYMCAARKEVPQDMDDDQMDFYEKFKASFDWAHAQYALAEEKFLLSLRVKPDFVDGMLALGQKDFESAKLNWSLAVASQIDLRAWDSSKTLELFGSAEAHAQKAAEFLAKREESQSKDTGVQGSGNAHHDAASLEQDAALKTQIFLFWGNILYEHSQVEFRLGLHSWSEWLDVAVHKFQEAGASSLDITTAIQKHLSSSSTFLDARELSGGEHDNGDSENDKIKEREETAANAHGNGLSHSGVMESFCEEHVPIDGIQNNLHGDDGGKIESSCAEHVRMDGISELLQIDSQLAFY